MRTQHAATPVVKGEKWASNLWIHVNDFITPFDNGDLYVCFLSCTYWLYFAYACVCVFARVRVRVRASVVYASPMPVSLYPCSSDRCTRADAAR